MAVAKALLSRLNTCLQGKRLPRCERLVFQTAGGERLWDHREIELTSNYIGSQVQLLEFLSKHVKSTGTVSLLSEMGSQSRRHGNQRCDAFPLKTLYFKNTFASIGLR